MAKYLQKATACSFVKYLSKDIDTDSTPTVTFYSPSGGVLIAAQNTTKGPETTVSEAISSGASTVKLAATTNIEVGDSLVLENSSGQKEVVTVYAVTDTQIETRYELLYSYEIGDRVHSRKTTVALSSSDLPNAYADCRAVYEYSSNSVVTNETHLFQVTHHDLSCPVTEMEILRRLPIARNLKDPRLPLSELIQEIWETEVLDEIFMSLPKNSIVSGESLKLACIHAVYAQLYRSNDQFDEADNWQTQLERDLERIVKQAPIDTNGDGSSNDELSYSRHTTRILWG